MRGNARGFTGSIDRIQGNISLLQVQRHRLLAKDLLAGLCGGDNDLGVRSGGGADHHCVDARVSDDLMVIGGELRHTKPLGHGLRGTGDGVGHGR